MLFSWAAKVKHKWYTAAINNTLVFFEYSERQRDGIRSTVWNEVIRGPAYHPLQEAFYKNPDLFNVMFNWDDHFECVVYRLAASCDGPDAQCGEDSVSPATSRCKSS